MYTMAELTRLKVWRERTPSRKDEKAQATPEPKRLGRVHNLVFAEDGRRVVGLMVKRPDVAGMIKQKDCFVALDALRRAEGGLVVSAEKDAVDEAACKRLGIDLETCFIWSGMPVKTISGKPLGYVMDARFNECTGAVDCFCTQEGSAATALVGSFEIPAAWFVRYASGTMVVRDEAASLELSGGLAGKAGEGYAHAKDGAKRAVAKADTAAAAAVDKGSHALGSMIGKAKSAFAEGSVQSAGKPVAGEGAPKDATAAARPAAASTSQEAGKKAARAVTKQLGKTKGMFSGFMREFKDASK